MRIVWEAMGRMKNEELRMMNDELSLVR